MRVCSTIVTLAILAMFTTGLRAPSLPTLNSAHDGEEQVSAYRSAEAPVLSPARHGRSVEASRKAPLVAVLPGRLFLSPTRSDFAVQTPLKSELGALPLSPRTSRGPPVST